jgi:predicted nucleic-acid-binding protein
VLQTSYRAARKDIARVVEELLQAEHLSFESSDRCWRALRRYASGRGGFADSLIAERARDAGCTSVATFDDALLGDSDFESP